MLDRTKAPEVPSFEPFAIKQVETNHVGIVPVHFLQSGDQHIMRLEFIYRAGSYFEEKNGLSYLTAKMLGEGSRNHSSKEIAEQIASCGAFIEIHHGHDLVNVTFFLLEKHLATLFPLIYEILVEPTFPESELDNLKSITNQNLDVNKEKGQFLASVEFRKALFGSDHPYGRQYWQEDIGKIGISDILLYYKETLQFQNLEIFVSGQFDGEELLKLLGSYFPDNSMRMHKRLNDVEYKSSNPSRVLVEKPGFLQSSIRMGRRTISRIDQDFPDLMVLNEIFGGFFGSRLMKNIREDKGYTYGIHSSVQSMHHATYMVIGTDVKKENTSQTLEEIAKEMQRLQRENIGDEELNTVKAYMLGKFINSINTPFALMDKFKILRYGGLKYEYFERYTSRIQAISSEEVRAFAANFFKHEEFFQVIVGGLG